MSSELDIATAPQLDHALGCARADDAALVILDLRELQFTESSGELVDHPPATPSAPVLDGVQP